MNDLPDPKEMLKAYQTVTGTNDSGLTILDRSHYRSAPLSNHKQVLEAIQQFAPRQGWLCFQSEIVRINGDQQSLPTEAGHILSGELVTDTNSEQSLHIQYVENLWSLTLLSDNEIDINTDTVATNNAVPVIFKRTRQSIDKDEVASYRVFYEYTADTYRPYCYRFTGFEPNTSANKG